MWWWYIRTETTFPIKRTSYELKFHITETQKRLTLVSKPLLFKELDAKPRLKGCNYCSLVGMITHLQVIYRTNISMDVHQYARFYVAPRLAHEIAITEIDRHLIDTFDRGIVCKTYKTKWLDCFVHVDFTKG